MTTSYLKTNLHLWLFAVVVLCTSCTSISQPPTEAQKVNTYMKNTMEEAYLWEEYIPQGLDPLTDDDPTEFFERLCYRQDDRWSYISDDIETDLEGTEGVETTYGYALAWGSFSNTENMFAIVRFVYPDTPASEAGIKRGDIFVKIDGNDITEDNYMDLYYSSHLSITFGEYKSDGIHVGRSLSLTARKQTLNPVVSWNIFKNGAHKAGYLCFTDFTTVAVEEFQSVFAAFKAAGVQDVILDLRYNPGGLLTTASALIGSLCPATCLDGNTLLISKIWNNFYMDYWTNNNRTDQLYTYFPTAEEIPYNLDLSRLYVITGDWTASASELLICGLDPYMDLTTIGSVTRGKYTAAAYFIPEEEEISNWGACSIIYKYANKLGVTGFKDGFIPDYEVDDVLLGDVLELGNPQELCLEKALSLIGFPTTAHAISTKNTFTGYTLNRADYPGRSRKEQLIDLL